MFGVGVGGSYSTGAIGEVYAFVGHATRRAQTHGRARHLARPAAAAIGPPGPRAPGREPLPSRRARGGPGLSLCCAVNKWCCC